MLIVIAVTCFALGAIPVIFNTENKTLDLISDIASDVGMILMDVYMGVVTYSSWQSVVVEGKSFLPAYVISVIFLLMTMFTVKFIIETVRNISE